MVRKEERGLPESPELGAEDPGMGLTYLVPGILFPHCKRR
jgi:hypothetical protein